MTAALALPRPYSIDDDIAWVYRMRFPELATVRHVSGSGQLDSFWEFLPSDGFPLRPPRVLLRVRLASAKPIEVEVPVYLAARPVVGAWMLVPIDDATWRLTSSVWRGVENLSESSRHHDDLPLGSFLLTCAPSHVSDEIRALG